MKAFEGIDQWWFGKGSPVALGVFRILIGINAFMSLVTGALDFGAWYTEDGYVPVQIGSRYLGGELPRLNLMLFPENTAASAIFYGIVTIAALLTTLGLWTRASSIILALGMISLHHRNAMILHSGDTLMRLMLIYVAVSPSGASCSLDRVIGLWKGKLSPEVPMVSLWGQRLLQLQISLVYFTTLWWKWYGVRWKDGTATWFPAQLTEFYRFPVPEFMDRQPFVAVTTYGTLVAEFALAVFVFYKPLRKWSLLAGLLLHAGIEYRMNIPFFATVICSGYICYYEGEEVSAWAKRLGAFLKRFRLKVRLPKGSELRPGPASALEAVDALNLVSYESGSEGSLSAINARGKSTNPILSGWARSVGAWILTPFGYKKMLLNAISPTPERESGEPAKKVAGATAT